jgi:uncharacterized membrane protein
VVPSLSQAPFARFIVALGEFMKTLRALAVGAVPLLGTGVALAQNGNMRNGGGWDMGWMGGYGGIWGIWGPILLVVVIVGAVVLVVQRKGK